MRWRADDSARKPSCTDVHSPYRQWGLGQPAQAPLGEMARAQGRLGHLRLTWPHQDGKTPRGGRIAGGT